MRYLRSRLVLEAHDIDSYRRLADRDGRSRLVLPAGTGFGSALVGTVSWPFGSLSYGELTGGLVSVAASGRPEAVFGVLLEGSAVLAVNGSRFRLDAGEAVVLLPGDAAVQSFQDAKLFVLRLDLLGAIGFQVNAVPYGVWLKCDRKLTSDSADDLLSLFRFVANEVERTDGRRDVSSTQIASIGQAISARCQDELVSRMQFKAIEDRGLLAICQKAAEALETTETSRPTTREIGLATGYSVRQLHRAFAVVASTTLGQFAHRWRMIRGRSVVVSSPNAPETVRQAAECAGFGAVTTFSRAYRAMFRESPNDTVAYIRDSLEDLGLAT